MNQTEREKADLILQAFDEFSDRIMDILKGPFASGYSENFFDNRDIDELAMELRKETPSLRFVLHTTPSLSDRQIVCGELFR